MIVLAFFLKRYDTQAGREYGEGEGGADENELESRVRHTPAGKCRSNANLRKIFDVFVAESFNMILPQRG